MASPNHLSSVNLPLRILKFGGSVLASEGSLDLAAAEIERSSRRARVIAVTSAFHGVTDQLLAVVRERFPKCSPEALASLLATGESKAAAFLSLALDARGIPSELLDPYRVGLLVRGTTLDAEPVDLDVRAVEKALSVNGVAVLPGFFGRRRSGALALLGRGGSDLTALFLTERLGAEECRLVKDVDGLYESDPAVSSDSPPRYAAASWEELLRVGGELVQKKAVEFARRHRLCFTIAAPLSSRGTRIGPVTEIARSAP